MIKKAVITAAGKGTRQYPATNAVQKELFPLVDLDGIAKPVIQIIAEQAVRAGIEELCIVVNPGEAGQFKRHFAGLSGRERASFMKKNNSQALEQSDLLNDLKKRIIYIEQTEQHGFGHAVWCARDFTGNDPFLLLLGDHIYLSDSEISCISQTLQEFNRTSLSLFPVCRTPMQELHLFGTVAGDPVPGSSGRYRVREIAEKPDPETARARLRTPGLGPDEFFTLFGMYALTPGVMTVLDRHVKSNVQSGGEIQLTTALQEITASEGAHALEILGRRLDMGTPRGYIETQVSLASRSVFSENMKRFIGE
jgi:UTP--glucose-1-phosphate uridylyltransferase